MSDLYLPRNSASEYFDGDPRSLQLAAALRALTELVEPMADAEAFVLWISTCRNAYLTINALFLDLREAIGHGSNDGLNLTLALLADSQFNRSERALEQIGLRLHEYGQKLDCWERANVFQERLNTHFARIPHAIQEHLRSALFTLRTRNDYQDLEWPEHFVKLSTDNPASLSKYWEVLGATADDLRVLARLARIIITTGKQVNITIEKEMGTKDNALLFPDPDNEKITLQAANAWHLFAQSIATLIPTLRTVDQPLIHPVENAIHLRVTTASLLIPDDFPQPIVALERLSGTASLLLEIISSIYEKLRTTFRANVAIAPLPPPYIVDLTDISRSGTSGQRKHVVVTPKPYSSSRPASVTIALPEITLVEKCIDTTTLRYKSDSDRAVATNGAELAIREAAAMDADIIAFPELFLPSNDVATLSALARELNIGFIAGEEGNWNEVAETYTNSVLIQLAGRLASHRQYKHKPSIYEPQCLATRGGQLCFENTPIGTFSVVVCNDYQEFDVLSAIEGFDTFIDILFVCSMNPYPDLWKAMALADSQRLFCFVVISNCNIETGRVGADAGSCVVRPGRASTEIAAKPFPLTEEAATVPSTRKVRLFDLPIDALVRDRTRSGDNLFSPPHRRMKAGTSAF